MPDTCDAATGSAVVWFRDDLRLADNPALHRAARDGRPVTALYVAETDAVRPLGGAARWWLAGSLRALAAALARHGVQLVLRQGRARDIVPAVARDCGAGAVVWNRRYEKAATETDAAIKAALKAEGLAAESFAANLLHEPWTVKSQSGGPLRVYTPFARAARTTGEPRPPLPVPDRLSGNRPVASDDLASYGLEPAAPDWADGLRATWTRGEDGAAARLRAFLETGLAGYAGLRDRPDLDHVSRLSPHLRFGEVSPFQVWHAAAHAAASGAAALRDVEKFHSELLWREFSWHLLHHYPDLATRNFQPRFDAFPWLSDETLLSAWRRGRTGYPVVDAGMRQLWTTGWMHNRVRMIVASFLVKHLLQDWRAGEAWFWDTLVDADAANNAASWQWVAGSGADAAPYFRVFNPVLQGEKFDPDGGYVRAHVPELARVPSTYLHKPWLAPQAVLAEAGVSAGRDYPLPVIDHAFARGRALAAFRSLKPDAA